MPNDIKFDGVELSAAEANVLAIRTLVEGARTSHWKSRIQKRLLDRVMDSMRDSLATGENVSQAIMAAFGGTTDGVPTTGVMKATIRETDHLINTAIAAVANQSRLLTFQKNAKTIKWVQQVSILDNKTSKTCLAYNGQVWDLQTLLPVAGSTLPFRGGPPRHFNCRSMLIPVLKRWQDMGVPATALSAKQKKNLDGSLPNPISFDQWLRGKSKRFQDKLLGPARARLWRSGTITLTQLVDMRGNPLTLDQLEKKIKNRRKR